MTVAFLYCPQAIHYILSVLVSESYAFLDRLPTGFLCNSSPIPVVELRTPAPMELVGGERLDTTGPVPTLGVPVGRHGLADWRAAVSRLSAWCWPAAPGCLLAACSGPPSDGHLPLRAAVCWPSALGWLAAPDWRLASAPAAGGLSVFCSGLPGAVRPVPLRGWESTTLAAVDWTSFRTAGGRPSPRGHCGLHVWTALS